MMDLVKPYLSMIAGAVVLAILAYSHLTAYRAGEAHIQKQFDSYKENVHDQVQKALNEKAKIEAEQDARFTMAQTGYAGAIDEFNRRLQHAEAMSRNGSVRVAGSSCSSMPSETGDSFRPVTALAAGGGICDSDFYAKAMREHVQCHYLLELVR